MKNILEEIKSEMGYSNLDDFEQAESFEQAEHYDNLDAEDFEQMDNAEYAEYLDFLDDIDTLDSAEGRKLLRGPVKRPLFRKGHHKKAARGARGKKRNKLSFPGGDRTKMSAIGAGKYQTKNASKEKAAFGGKAYIDQLMMASKGDLNITVTRSGVTLATPLPYILFNLNGFSSSFLSTLRQYLPSGITVAATNVAATGNLLLTYTDGTNTDTVTISLTGSPISYMEFLQNMSTNFFKTTYIRQEYPNDSNLLTACSQPINFGLLSALGMNNKNSLLPRSRRQNADFQTFIINIPLPEQKVTTDFSFVQNIVAVNNYTIAWDVFMSDRKNLNNL